MSIKSKGKTVVEQITGIFAPVINIITAVSIIKGLLIIFSGAGILDSAQGVYRIFYACSDGFFYFLPFYLAVTAAEQWKTDRFIAMLIPAAMLYPDITSVLENGEGAMTFLGMNVPQTVYHSSVIPVLLAVGLLKYTEKLCNRFIPDSVRGFTRPIVCCLTVLPLTFMLFGPLGKLAGDFLTGIFFSVYDFNPVLAGAFMGFFIQPMVCVGAHWSIVPVCINNIAVNGYDVILPLLGGAVYGQAGSVLAVGFMYGKQEKYSEKRKTAFQAALSAALGVTEPALFGVNISLPRSMISACIAGAAGGAMAGAAGCHCSSFAFPSFITSVVYTGDGFAVFLLSMAAGFVVSLLLMFMQRKRIKAIILE